MEVIKPGHVYDLMTLDGDGTPQRLTFVMRNEPQEKYPGNDDAFPGVTSQEVLRALIDRLNYVQNQIPCDETGEAVMWLERVLWLFERRAKRRRGEELTVAPKEVVGAESCPTCGHVFCTKHG